MNSQIAIIPLGLNGSYSNESLFPNGCNGFHFSVFFFDVDVKVDFGYSLFGCPPGTNPVCLVTDFRTTLRPRDGKIIYTVRSLCFTKDCIPGHINPGDALYLKLTFRPIGSIITRLNNNSSRIWVTYHTDTNTLINKPIV
jgi:hypothetical protein